MNFLHKAPLLYQPKKIIQKEIKLTINSDYSTLEKNKDLQNNTTNKIQLKPTKEKKLDFNIEKEKEKEKEKLEEAQKISIGKINDINNHEKSKKNEKYYLSREIALTIEKYGREMFSTVKENESKFLVPINFMDRHSLTPSARERMVDWMVEVFSVYKCDPGTFELAVHIMDCYISKSQKILYDEDIHLIGLTCIYISSKVEDIIPLRMSHIVKSIGHMTFNEKEIMEKEREIIKTIDFDLFTAGTFDYLMTFFYDLKVNNAKKISKFNGILIVEKFMNFSILLSQLLLYSNEFVCYRQSLNSLAVLALAFDILKTNIKNLNKDLKNFLSDWVFYVINEMGFKTDAISVIYDKISKFYHKKIILPQKSKEKKKLNKKKKNKDDDDDDSDIINLCKFNQDKFI
jgi:hypothetical protein